MDRIAFSRSIRANKLRPAGNWTPYNVTITYIGYLQVFCLEILILNPFVRWRSLRTVTNATINSGNENSTSFLVLLKQTVWRIERIKKHEHGRLLFWFDSNKQLLYCPFLGTRVIRGSIF